MMKQKKALGKRTTLKKQEELHLDGSLSHNEELGELQSLFRTVEKNDLQEKRSVDQKRYAGKQVQVGLKPC